MSTPTPYRVPATDPGYVDSIADLTFDSVRRVTTGDQVQFEVVFHSNRRPDQGYLAHTRPLDATERPDLGSLRERLEAFSMYDPSRSQRHTLSFDAGGYISGVQLRFGDPETRARELYAEASQTDPWPATGQPALPSTTFSVSFPEDGVADISWTEPTPSGGIFRQTRVTPALVPVLRTLIEEATR